MPEARTASSKVMLGEVLAFLIAIGWDGVGREDRLGSATAAEVEAAAFVLEDGMSPDVPRR